MSVQLALRFDEAPITCETRQSWLIDLSRAPIHPPRKVQFGTIHAVLTLQKKYGYAGWFRIKGYLERDFRNGYSFSDTAMGDAHAYKLIRGMGADF
jgi:hypothetical protein